MADDDVGLRRAAEGVVVSGPRDRVPFSAQPPRSAARSLLPAVPEPPGAKVAAPTVKERLTGVALVFPAASVDRSSKACEPLASVEV